MKHFPEGLPEEYIEKAKELEVLPEQVDEQFVRGSGKGGQKINKTSSCVLLRHEPSGVEVRCQKHREQSKNRISAYKLLIRKVEEQVKGVLSEEAQKVFKIRKQKKRRSKRAKEKILEEKHHRSEIKKMRGPVQDD